jgi:hypothetical protein
MSIEQRGTDPNYILKRLRDLGRMDLVGAIESGAVSAHAVAIGLGWTRRRSTVTGTGSPNRRKRTNAALTKLGLGNGKALAPETAGELSLRDAIEACELAWGPDATGSVFADTAELRAAWDRLGTIVSATCRRPYAAEVLKRLDRKKNRS